MEIDEQNKKFIKDLSEPIIELLFEKLKPFLFFSLVLFLLMIMIFTYLLFNEKVLPQNY